MVGQGVRGKMARTWEEKKGNCSRREGELYEKGRRMAGEKREREGERLRSVWRNIKSADSGIRFGAANYTLSNFM